MIKTLNIVNGDACIRMMREAKIEGDFLPWQDFLHEGPVPINVSLKEFATIRARFIASYGLAELKDIQKTFEERDKKLNLYKLYDKVVLWFEHDLYDQLQLLQILSWFASQDLNQTKLSMICTRNYLGESSAQEIRKLLDYETPISNEHFQLAQKAWSAFCAKTPRAWASLLDEPTGVLPFLKGAVYRMLQEYPNTKCGLSRTAYQALLIISSGINEPVNIFTKCQDFEERKFMGDLIFFKILNDFKVYDIIQEDEEKLHITSLGEALLNGHKSWMAIKPLEHSIGGVTLSLDNLWSWDMKKKEINNYYYSKPLEMLLRIK